ncbi:MAG TPA: NAD(P)-dependent alcohol dehydrogenase [Polyangiaceae bacterium]|nr:NAD(P)-dependent alcohol dehydrogenase [Polyangiaceae bacterium]
MAEQRERQARAAHRAPASDEMWAVRFDKFGGPEVLRLARVPQPTPGHGQVRVSVRAASINPIDWKIRRGQMRLMSGSTFPMSAGGDFAGIIDAVGPDASPWRVGDEVFGLAATVRGGALAEAIVVPSSHLARRPPAVPPEQAAGAVTALASLQALRDVARVARGQHVLINGCAGGMGLAAIQIAKAMGARVTGTCAARGIALARELGADEVLDYRAVDVVDRGGSYDVVLDLATSLGFERARRVLGPRGTYVDPAPTPARLLGHTVANLFRRQKYRALLSSPRAADLAHLSAEMGAGRLRTHVEAVFDLRDIEAGYRRAEAGAVLGKVVVRTANAESA